MEGTRELSAEEDMAFVTRARETRALLPYLRANPAQARIMGAAITRMARGMREAYPGRVRERTHANAEWRAAGYSDVAEANELMGLAGR